MVDSATRYTAAAIVRSKKKEVIVQKVLQIWMAYFGSPFKCHSDCGREFANDVLKEIKEVFGTETSATPWRGTMEQWYCGERKCDAL